MKVKNVLNAHKRNQIKIEANTVAKGENFQNLYEVK